MRLVCEKCGAVHAIEDRMAGERAGMTCKECGTPLVAHRPPPLQSSAPPPVVSGLPPLKAGGALASISAVAAAARLPAEGFAPSGTETWFVSLGDAQQGPYSAAEFSQLLEQERVDWGTPVWRDGLKDWRPARRDAFLVTSVAGARGHAGDTMRLQASRSLLTPEDTVIDLRPRSLLPSSPEPLDLSEGADLSSSSETHLLDARELGVPNLAPSVRPSAWSSPQNESFRAGLGLSTDPLLYAQSTSALQSLGPRSSLSAAPSLTAPAAPTLAEAFGSAPSLLRTTTGVDSTAELDVAQRPLGSSTLSRSAVPKAHSMLAVAAVAFAAGVVVAGVYTFFVRSEIRSAPQETSVIVAPKPIAKPKPEPTPLPSTEPLRELPEPEELRAEVRHVAPEVRRCVENPAEGVDVDIYLDGPSGRVRDVAVRSPALSPGRVQCVSHAVRKMQLLPFARPELKLMHRFSW